MIYVSQWRSLVRPITVRGSILSVYSMRPLDTSRAMIRAMLHNVVTIVNDPVIGRFRSSNLMSSLERTASGCPQPSISLIPSSNGYIRVRYYRIVKPNSQCRIMVSTRYRDLGALHTKSQHYVPGTVYVSVRYNTRTSQRCNNAKPPVPQYSDVSRKQSKSRYSIRAPVRHSIRT